MHPLPIHRSLAALVYFASFAEYALAQGYVWGFHDANVTTNLPECNRLQVFVGPSPPGSSSAGQPPYYLIAYEANGISTLQMVGTDINNLFWNVDHAAGSQLIISMTDGAGNPGGVAQELFTVVSGPSTSCHPQSPTSPISITTNTTKNLNSCDILPLKISGGQMPYTVTIAARDSTSVTNVSMGPYDTYNWVNRASPNSQLIATVSDATGKYGAATALLSTAGSTDLTCGGLQSTFLDSASKLQPSHSGSAAVPKATDNANPHGDSSSGSNSGGGSKTSLGTIIGGAVAGVVLIGALLAGLLFFLRRRKSRYTGPRQYIDRDSHQGYGLGKVVGTPNQSNYPGVPVAEEITPFVMSGGPSGPYRDNDQSRYTLGQYSQSHYTEASSSSRADTLVGAPLQPDQYGRLGSAPMLPPGAAPSPPMSPGAMSHPMSTSSFDPYATHSNAPTRSMSDPRSLSVYSTSTSQPSGQSSSAGPRSVSGSAAGPIAGGSGSSGLLTVANPSANEQRSTDVKGGALPPQPPPQAVYQHEDVADVEELPPAYKERTA